MRVESLADHLNLVPVVAGWHWSEWGHLDPTGSLESWTCGLRLRSNRGRVPATFILLDGDRPIGSTSLVEHDMSTRSDLSPWIAGVYVLPEHRGRGAGSLLMRHSTAAACAMGVSMLYLYTASAAGFYKRLGWRRLWLEPYEGRMVTIMALDLSPR